MLSIRYGVFETNSSSECTFAVHVIQTDGLEIPHTVHIETINDPWENSINGCYAMAKRNNQTNEFLYLLQSVGVQEIYVDGKLVSPIMEFGNISYGDKKAILAKCFGIFLSFSEWQGHGGEWDNTHYLDIEEIKTIQKYYSNPDFLILCYEYDENDNPNEVYWTDTRFAHMEISDKDLQEFRKRKAEREKWEKEYYDSVDNNTDYYYSENEPQEPYEEGDEYDNYIPKSKSPHNRKKRNR